MCVESTVYDQMCGKLNQPNMKFVSSSLSIRLTVMIKLNLLSLSGGIPLSGGVPCVPNTENDRRTSVEVSQLHKLTILLYMIMEDCCYDYHIEKDEL